MQSAMQNVSISTDSGSYTALVLFLGFLAAALLTHIFNLRSSVYPASGRAIALALCSRRFYLAAASAAIALVMPMGGQFFVIVNARNPMSSTYLDAQFTIATMTLVFQGFAIVASLAAALMAVNGVLPPLANSPDLTAKRVSDSTTASSE